MKIKPGLVSKRSCRIWRNSGTVPFRRTTFCRALIFQGWATTWWYSRILIFCESQFISFLYSKQDDYQNLVFNFFFFLNLETLSKTAAKTGCDPFWMPERRKENSGFGFESTGKSDNLICPDYVNQAPNKTTNPDVAPFTWTHTSIYSPHLLPPAMFTDKQTQHRKRQLGKHQGRVHLMLILSYAHLICIWKDPFIQVLK